MDTKTRQFQPNDLAAIKAISHALHPNWFDKDAFINIPIDVQIIPTVVAIKDGHVVGFISYSSKDGKPEIFWLGISPEYHRQGIGKQLVQVVIEKVKLTGAKKLCVETVGECEPPDIWYGQTVSFYESLGFTKLTSGPEKHFQQYTYKMCVFQKDL